MSSITLAFSSDRDRPHGGRPADGHHGLAVDAVVQPLATLATGARGVVVEIGAADDVRADRLLSLGVTQGARITVLQTFPGVVFLCDQTELAVERIVASSIYVRIEGGQP
jgi:DtxR family Mn-dependent transcriptional regulator